MASDRWLTGADRVAWAAVLGVVVASIWLTVTFVHLDQIPPGEDAPARLLESLAYLNPGPHLSPYPPATYAVTSVAYGLFGTGVDVAVLSLVAWMALFLVSMAWLGQLAAGPLGAVTLVTVAAGVPRIAVFARSYFLDLPSTATVALAFAALVASRGLTRRGPVLVLGVALALGMLTRWTFLYFLAGPLVVTALRVVRQGRPRRRLVGATLVLVALTAVALVRLAIVMTPEIDTGDPHSAFPIPHQTGSGASGTVMGLAWLVLAAWAWRRRREDAPAGEWNPGASLALATALGVMGSLWWYLGSLRFVYTKWLYQAAEFTGRGEDPAARLLANVVDLSYSAWALPIWLAIGIPLSLAAPKRWLLPEGPTGLRHLTILSLAGLVPALLLVSGSAPVSPRYLLPAVVFVVVLGFAWSAKLPRVRWGVLIGVLVLSPLQVGWWLPGESELPVDTQVVTRRPNHPGAYELLSLPTTRAPDPGPYPLLETLKRVVAEGGAWVSVVRSPGAPVEERSFEAVARLEGLGLRVGEGRKGLRGPDGDPDHIILTMPATRSLEEALRTEPRLEDTELVECWEAGTRDRRSQGVESMVPSRWCLFRL